MHTIPVRLSALNLVGRAGLKRSLANLKIEGAKHKCDDGKIKRKSPEMRIEQLLRKELRHRRETAADLELGKEARSTPPYGYFNYKMIYDGELPKTIKVTFQKKRQ
jgi:hypothetical protein